MLQKTSHRGVENMKNRYSIKLCACITQNIICQNSQGMFINQFNNDDIQTAAFIVVFRVVVVALMFEEIMRL